MTVLDAMDHPAVFASVFAEPTWKAWRVFLKSLFGLPLTPEELRLYQQHTDQLGPRRKVAREGWMVVGRRGGKSRIAALVAVYLACFRDYQNVLAPGEHGTVMLIASDRRQARVLKRYVSGLFQAVPMLAQLLITETTESIHLANRIAIEIHTANFRSIRGYTVVAAILDEIAFWPIEDAANPDTEIVNALRPAMATIPEAVLLAISSPYARRGELWRVYREHFGRDDDPVLVWQADTRTMNPNVDEAIIAEAYAADEAVASAEYGAQFRRDIEGFLSRELLETCVIAGRVELPPISDHHYFAFVDPSGGSSDSMALAIAHREEKLVVLDCVREVKPHFSPEAVAAEFTDLLKRYRVGRVVGDRYGGEWPREQFRKRGVDYVPSQLAKSDLYRELLPLVNAQNVVLLDQPRLLMQLSNLERRTTRGGRDSIDHPPGAHDDVANVAAGSLLLAAQREPVSVEAALHWAEEAQRLMRVAPLRKC
ncbi:hypothetical protein MYX04_12470 [Nitrospiraceae bacterium AH_259_D15_M11_P09]|nr:hypothetical protein [Nitrospiraceae bacterium AH_259_D15_M11_P09]